MDKQALAVYQRYWYQWLWNYCGDIPGLTPILDILEQGPVGDETLFEFKGRFQGLAYDYKDQLKDVVGGVQEEREPGDDPGDDEDRTMESAANRLQKEAKGYLDSLRGKKA
ncbi:BAR adaptor protein Hob3 [Exophiala xenobiotica]|nr:BAR adaptor protein Hob3 [Exophiala xenobiotica]